MAEYIERDAAIRTIQDQFVVGETTPEYQFVNNGLAIAISKICSLPINNITPEAPAQWIPVTNGRGGHECSRCHNYALSYQDGSECLSKYCPNCGAFMSGTKEG